VAAGLPSETVTGDARCREWKLHDEQPERRLAERPGKVPSTLKTAASGVAPAKFATTSVEAPAVPEIT
jgi:hypothetical protein